MEKVRYRHNVTTVVVGVVMFCGGVALATSRWYLAPVLLVPIAMIVWGLRGGTDVDAKGVKVRALVGSKRLAWPQIDGFTRHGDKVLATLSNGRSVTLPAVGPGDLPALMRAGGHPVDAVEPDDDTDTDQ